MSARSPAVAPKLTEVSGIVYGVHLHGRLPGEFRSYLRSPRAQRGGVARSVEVSFEVVSRLPEVEPIWAAEPAAGAGGRMALFGGPADFGLIVAGADARGVFRITPPEIAIGWLPGGAGSAFAFFSYALPLWLESAGVPLLHASAVSLGERAVAFVGQSGIGKSTLCAGLVDAGCNFVADDGLPLEEDEHGDWRCPPGSPWLRLWPSALDRLGIPAADLARAQPSVDKRLLPGGHDSPGATAGGPKLAAVYVLMGRGESAGGPTMRPCTPREALVRLIEHSLAGAPVAALGWAAPRLRRLARVATRIPVHTLSLPAGTSRWRRIREAIFGDLPDAPEPGRPDP